MEWTEESINRLRSLWQEGLSTAEIGRRMQISKNAVVGKAHRLMLSPRPSPIRKGADRPDRGTPPAGPVQPPRLQAAAEPVPELLPEPVRPQPSPTQEAQAARPTLVPVAAPNRPPLAIVAATEPAEVEEPAAAERPALRPVAVPERRRGLTCCWPLGEPGTREFHFCGGDPIAGKPYCAEHAALAYVRIRDRRDSVA